MNGYYYLNHTDLSEEALNEIMRIAEEEIREDKAQCTEIKKMFGAEKLDTIIRERAEKVAMNLNYVFNF